MNSFVKLRAIDGRLNEFKETWLQEIRQSRVMLLRKTSTQG